jgi:hypothetical protein
MRVRTGLFGGRWSSGGGRWVVVGRRESYGWPKAAAGRTVPGRLPGGATPRKPASATRRCCDLCPLPKGTEIGNPIASLCTRPTPH